MDFKEHFPHGNNDRPVSKSFHIYSPNAGGGGGGGGGEMTN